MKENRAKNGGEDKFYTRPFISDYTTQITLDTFGCDKDYIEPSAGSGVFIDSYKKLSNLSNIQGYDISPDREDIIQQDWLTTSDWDIKGKVVLGNPPFGFGASLAIDFFNKAAQGHAHAICFIIPKTFRKVSTHQKLDLNYKLTLDIDIPKNAFFFHGSDDAFYDVPTVFQIWKRDEKNPREVVKTLSSSEYFSFVAKDAGYDVAVRRAGGRAGQIVEGDLSPSTTYFLRLHDARVFNALKIYDYKKYIDNTAGVRSISKHELITEMDRIINALNEEL